MREDILKGILIFLNFFMWFSGWVVLALGLHMLSDGNNVKHYTHQLFGPSHEIMNFDNTQLSSYSDSHSTDTKLDAKGYGDKMLTSSTANKGNQIFPDSKTFTITISPSSSGPVDTTASDKRVRSYDDDDDDNDDGDPNVLGGLGAEGGLLVTGALVVVAGLVGCIATSQKDKTLLLAYGCMMILAGVTEIGVGTWCLVECYHSTLSQDVLLQSPSSPSSQSPSQALPQERLSLDHSTLSPVERLRYWYGQPQHEPYTRALDELQQKISCCGLTGPEDYLDSAWQKQSPSSLPSSCCSIPQQPEVDHTSSTQLPFLSTCQEEYNGTTHITGCLLLLSEWMKKDLLLIGIGIIAVGIFQITGASITLHLRRQMRVISCGNIPPLDSLLF